MNDHKDAVRISKQPEGTYDHRAVLNLKARYLEVVAQLEAERKLNNDLALGNLKAQHAGSLLIRDLRGQLEVLQRARITNVSDVMRENEALRKDAEIAALRKDYNELIMALAAATQMVSVPRIKAGSQDGWLVEFAWLKKVKTALRSMPDWEDCSIDLEEIEAVALAMLAAKGDRNG